MKTTESCHKDNQFQKVMQRETFCTALKPISEELCRWETETKTTCGETRKCSCSFSISFLLKKMATRGRPGKNSAVDETSKDIQINLLVTDQDGRHMYFKVSQELELTKVFKEFCERRNLELHTMHFSYDGTHIRGNQTPKLLNMEDGAEIFAARHQLGGGVTAICNVDVTNAMVFFVHLPHHH
ncbi:hypothetical protein VNO80_20546 [Phaseolus coccineus]|uniref:Ubiquitin-like domain-containing protein n=1 Tax=Phaseolus coccineus TaxID=3886 RepID=A0AAN9M5W2_PHACN